MLPFVLRFGSIGKRASLRARPCVPTPLRPHLSPIRLSNLVHWHRHSWKVSLEVEKCPDTGQDVVRLDRNWLNGRFIELSDKLLSLSR
jgi:hypothetical protein